MGPREEGETWMRRATSSREEEGEELRDWARAPYTPEWTKMCWKRSVGFVETSTFTESTWENNTGGSEVVMVIRGGDGDQRW